MKDNKVTFLSIWPRKYKIISGLIFLGLLIINPLLTIGFILLTYIMLMWG